MTDDQNMKAAEQTFSGFMAMMKWGTVVTVVIVAIVILLIAG